MTEITLIFDQLRHFKARALLVLVAITLAFFAYGVLGTLRYSLNSGEQSVSEWRLIVTHKNGVLETLPLASLDRIKDIPGVGMVGHATWLGHYYQEQKNMLMSFAVDAESWLAQHPDMAIDEASRDRFLKQRDGLLVSQALAHKFGWRVGDRLPLKSILFPPPAGDPAWTYNIAGIFTSSDTGGGRNYIITHYEYLNENRDLWKNTVGSYIVTPAAASAQLTLGQRIDETFAQTQYPTASKTDRAFHNEFFAQYGDVVLMVKSIIAVNFASLILVVTSSMALSVKQSSRDIGVLRVIGFSAGRIYRLVSGQIAVLILAGSMLGLGLAAGFNRWITLTLPQFIPDVVMPLPVLQETAAISVVLVLVTALIPVWIALAVKPIDTLTMEVLQ